MSAAQPSVEHPAPQRDELAPHEGFFALFGGPIAWLIQLCAGFALATQPCFRDGERIAEPPLGAHWTGEAMVVLLIAGVIIALLSLWVSWRVFKRTRSEDEGDHHQVMEVGSGRTRFLALWGIYLGAGFAIATTFTAAGFLTLQRCAG